jgi:RNA polymerase sigma-70 factor (ECF subfamily)
VDLADEDSSPATACERAERGRIVAQTIAELPEPLRVVLLLRHFEEMTFEQIARLLGEPASTIKSRFSVSLRRLRERLRFLCEDPTEPER